MNYKVRRELLQDPAVIEEINKHRWYESEKKGTDVGFEFAADDWLKKYSGSWMKQSACKCACGSWFAKLFLRDNSKREECC
jgi:hypothetical protein